MWLKDDPQILSKAVDLAKYTGISYVVAWGGTFLINLVRAPKLLHDEALSHNAVLAADARRVGIVNGFLRQCSK